MWGFCSPHRCLSSRHGGAGSPRPACPLDGRLLAQLLQRSGKFPAGADVELGEHFREVVFDSPGAEEELRGDLGIRVALAGEPGDVALLGSEHDRGLGGAFADRLASRGELAARPLGEGFRPHLRERLVRVAQLIAGLSSSVRASQPLAVEQAGAGEVPLHTCRGQAVDGVAVERIGVVAVG